MAAGDQWLILYKNFVNNLYNALFQNLKMQNVYFDFRFKYKCLRIYF